MSIPSAKAHTRLNVARAGLSSALHQPFEVVALLDRPGRVGEAAAQLLHDPARALDRGHGFLERTLLVALVAPPRPRILANRSPGRLLRAK